MLFALVAVPACSGDNGQNGQPDAAGDAGQDAGEDAGSDAGADRGIDGGPDAGQDAGARPDHDPAESFLLEIPPGAGLCTVFCEGRTWQEEYQMIGRIDLAPGYYVLPRTEAPLDAELIGNVVFGPEHLPAVAAGPGSFDVTEYYGSWQYIYRQDFTLQSRPYHLDVWIWFDSYYWAPDWPAETTLEGEFAASYVYARAILGPGDQWCEDHQGFTFGDLSSMSGADYLGTTADGDWVLAEVRHAQGCMVAGNTGCDEVDRAEVSLGETHHEVTDPLQLIYSAEHHNFARKFLILLDQPDGAVAAVLVEAPDFGATEGGALVTLNGNMTPIETKPFIDWQSSWH